LPSSSWLLFGQQVCAMTRGLFEAFAHAEEDGGNLTALKIIAAQGGAHPPKSRCSLTLQGGPASEVPPYGAGGAAASSSAAVAHSSSFLSDFLAPIAPGGGQVFGTSASMEGPGSYEPVKGGQSLDDGGGGIGDEDGQVLQYWAVEGSDGHIHTGKVRHVAHHDDRTGDTVVVTSKSESTEEVGKPSHHHSSSDGKKKLGEERSKEGAAESADDEPPHRVQVQVVHVDPLPPPQAEYDDVKDEAPVATRNDAEAAEDHVSTGVLVGGALAIFTQVYLWGTVFVTLFKAAPRPPAAFGDDVEASPGDAAEAQTAPHEQADESLAAVPVAVA